MSEATALVNDLIDFIYESPSPFHVVANAKKRLLANGFSQLCLKEKWNLEKGGKYFTDRNGSALTAFIVGSGEVEEEGYRVVAAHTDFPSFHVKPSPEMTDNHYLKLNTEAFGSAILNTWLDRPLSLAGRVSLRSDDILHPEELLVNIKKPLLIIPNQSIHMNKKVNEGVELNKQKDLLPLLGMTGEDFSKEGYLSRLLAGELSVKAEDILDFELWLYEFEKGRIIGVNDEFVCSSRLDNLTSVHAALNALVNARPGPFTSVAVFFDDEEVGNRTKQGADSRMLYNTLERVALAQGKGPEEFFRAVYRSFMLSCDCSHAVHPNAPEKHDPLVKPVINGGPVIKISANRNFTTDSNSSAVYQMICERAGVPFQKFVSRSDMPGGSTIGPASVTQLDLQSIDIGSALFAMHSIRETGGVMDHHYLEKSFEEFYRQG
ncbi:MAG: M18 family aminopeptidase [Synergistaceae bacterium]|jgi:aspartyl aminopeptidase|nr:M18 family aminopeptidase [Synergistaceae bacterium]